MILGPAAPQPDPSDEQDRAYFAMLQGYAVAAFLFLFGGD
jgi:hypothetical protein